MLGICNRIKNTADYYKDFYLGTVKQGEKLVLAAVMTIPDKLVVYSNMQECDEAINLLLEDLHSKNIEMSGVVGPKELSKKVCDIWKKHSGCDIKLEMNMRVYEIREVNKNMIGKGILRLANKKDLDFVGQGICEFQVDTGLSEIPDKDKCYELASKRLLEETIFIWEDSGKAVSMAAKARPTQNGATINLVYTPKELRKKGYATSCVAALSQHLLDSGYRFCSLFTDLANPISNNIYMKIGYQPVGDYDSYIKI
ncbi:MAG: GNAT family N-acetyltransferase [Epulopiscium sp.]|nr:GNAT family N-acetyltransferase [Candidatus Epulonipiscium sp.]